MKGLSWFNKFLFFLNSIFAGALLFAYLLPFIPPKTFALLSVFSLAVPFFIYSQSQKEPTEDGSPQEKINDRSKYFPL